MVNRKNDGRRASRLLMAATATTLALAVVSGPQPAALADEVPDKLLIEKGREVFLTAGGVGCIACHGRYAEGDTGIGPYNRGVGEPVIRAALESVEAMKLLPGELSDAQIKQIAAYYQWLGQLKLVKTLIKRGRFVPEHLEIHPGTRIQLVLNNASTASRLFISDNMGIGPVTVEGRQAVDVVWEAPQKEGLYTLACADCELADQKLTIEVTKKAPKFIPAMVVSKLPASAPPGSTSAPSKPAAASREDPQTIERGRQVFLTAGDIGCVACHGRYAEGDVGIGPYNRGFSEAAIRRALRSVRPMSFLRETLSEEEIKQVAAYYESLSHQQLVKTHAVRGMFIPESVKVHPGTTVQLVVMNPSLKTRTFTSRDMNIEKFTVAGRDALDFVWKAPEREGTFTLECTDCAITGQKFAIEVTESVPVYTPPVVLK